MLPSPVWRVLVLLAFVASARAETWHLHAAIGNDAFTQLIPPLPDDGFTNDLALAIRRADHGLAIGGSIFHRMITDSPQGLRVDQLDLLATADRTLTPWLVAGARIGPTFTGNLGGRALQNWWHGFSHTGPTIAQGLPSLYPGEREAAVLVGGHVRAETGDVVRAYVAVDAQLALGGTGVSVFETAVGGIARAHVRTIELAVHFELAGADVETSDPWLALPLAYHRGWHVAWRVGTHVAWGANRISYEYRANEGGSGEPIGIIAYDRAI